MPSKPFWFLIALSASLFQNNVVYTSVTTLIEKYKEKFNVELIIPWEDSIISGQNYYPCMTNATPIEKI